MCHMVFTRLEYQNEITLSSLNKVNKFSRNVQILLQHEDFNWQHKIEAIMYSCFLQRSKHTHGLMQGLNENSIIVLKWNVHVNMFVPFELIENLRVAQIEWLWDNK